MIPSLPPIQSLRAFEAAARHLSDSRAADELHLTHGAISHHVKVRAGLRLLAEAMENARPRPRPRRPVAKRALSVSVLPSLAARWLVPRLSRFQASHPEIDIAIHPTSTLAALNGGDGIDLAIRYGPGQWHGLRASPLMKSFIFPVCSPAFRARTEIRSPGDLLKFTLLRNPRQMWRPWFAAAGLDVPEPAQGPVYDDAGLLLQAAVAGQGIALARSVLVQDDLATGRLVRLSDLQIEDDYGWFLVWREPLHAERTEFDAFSAWLQSTGCPIACRSHSET